MRFLKFLIFFLPILGDPPQRVRTPNEFVEGFDDGQEHRPVRSLLLPAVQHELVNSLRTVHGGRQSVALLDGLDHVLVAPVPVRPLAVRHHLPHDDAERPHVRSGRELAESDGFGCGPPNRYLTALEIRKLSINNNNTKIR